MAREAESGAADARQAAATPAVAEQRRFKVALSFSGEQLEFVEAVAQALASTFGRNAVFFYPWYQHETNGIGALSQQAPDFYLKHADLTASFILESSVERAGVCGFPGAGQGATTRNGCSIAFSCSCNAAMRPENRAIQPIALSPHG